MKCRYCKRKIAPTDCICPNCGKKNPQPDTDPAMFAMRRKAIMYGCLAALAVLAITLFVAMQSGWDLGSSFDWLKPKENTIYYKDSYTVSDGKADRKSEDVVAVMGDAQLTNGQLQVYYWMQVYNFLESYGNSVSNLGLDLSKPLDQQLCMDGTSTWQQYFLESALQVWQSDQAFALEAQRNGYALPEEQQALLDGFAAELEKKALAGGYADANAMLRAEMGAGCNAEAYVAYMQVYYLGYQYFQQQYAEIQPTMEQIEAYYESNLTQLSGAGFGKDAGNYVDVRHILIMPQGGTIYPDGSIRYSDAAWEVCMQEAEAVLSQWEAGDLTEDAFTVLASQYSDDSSTRLSGGLIANLTKGSMDESFDSWCFAAHRTSGDYGLVKTDLGYHLIYFVESEAIWLAEARNALIQQQGQKMVDTVMAQYSMTADYRKIVLGKVDLSK